MKSLSSLIISLEKFLNKGTHQDLDLKFIKEILTSKDISLTNLDLKLGYN